ncbi:dihydrofolate reductase family protein [Streptomyces zhihengii]
MAGGTTFHFVTDGITAALARARASAGDGEVAVVGGATTLNQYLAAGLIDELRLAISPVTLGSGTASSRASRPEAGTALLPRGEPGHARDLPRPALTGREHAPRCTRGATLPAGSCRASDHRRSEASPHEFPFDSRGLESLAACGLRGTLRLRARQAQSVPECLQDLPGVPSVVPEKQHILPVLRNERRPDIRRSRSPVTVARDRPAAGARVVGLPAEPVRPDELHDPSLTLSPACPACAHGTNCLLVHPCSPAPRRSQAHRTSFAPPSLFGASPFGLRVVRVCPALPTAHPGSAGELHMGKRAYSCLRPRPRCRPW